MQLKNIQLEKKEFIKISKNSLSIIISSLRLVYFIKMVYKKFKQSKNNLIVYNASINSQIFLILQQI